MKRMWMAWLGFGLCSSAILAIAWWGGRKVIELDGRERNARKEAALEENVRLSLWRMETALTAIIVQENSRPYTAYLSQDRQRRNSSRPGSLYVKLHFQIDPGGKLESFSIADQTPDVDAAVLKELSNPNARRALSAAIPSTWLSIDRAVKPKDTRVAAAPPQTAIEPGRRAESTPATVPVQQAEAAPPRIDTQLPLPTQFQMSRNVQEFEARGMLNQSNAALGSRPAFKQSGPRAPEEKESSVEVRTSALTPVWLGNELLLARQVQLGSGTYLQGCWIDWLKARSLLLASIQDLLPGSDLTPERGRFDPAEGRTLTSLPLRLVPGRVPGTTSEEGSAMLFSLRVAWVCMVVAIGAVGFLLMGALTLGQRRAAFVSSVTHELRTPLTTFKLYTEMLVSGMASDPSKQSEYHQTLYRESDRLVHLVENVLSYARLEKGRYGDRETLSLQALIERSNERLAEHARLAGMQLEVATQEGAGEKVVCVDTSAIERILFNLVDNACKHANSAIDRRIHVDVGVDDRWARITVRDYGPGIDRRMLRRIFKPFRKSARDAARTAPGIGIGLPLSSRLARAANGRLVIVDCDKGACLRLELPLFSGQ